mgnify:CR=1 FL=1
MVREQVGAGRLVGRGDMLLLGPAASVAQRIQGAWVEESEVRDIVGHWREQAPVVEERYTEGVADETDRPGGEDPVTASAADPNDDDELLKQAWELVVRSQLGSTSMLQRKLRVGFPRAGRLMDLPEERGIVGASDGSTARTVLMPPAALQALLHRTVRAGGEGLMLHRGASLYRAGRSDDLIKVKTHEDTEARVVAHLPGKGRHAGRLGALLVETPSGQRFRLGAGFSDADRERPPPVGSWVTYRFRGTHDGGLPRFASFVPTPGRLWRYLRGSSA